MGLWQGALFHSSLLRRAEFVPLLFISLLQVAKKYEASFSLQVGWQSYVILNGFKIIKEAMGQKAEDFADRPPVPLLKLAGFSKNCEGKCCL